MFGNTTAIIVGSYLALMLEFLRPRLRWSNPELDGRAILIGGQTSDTHVTAKLEPWQSYFHEAVTN